MQNKKSFFVIGAFALIGVTMLSLSFAGSGDGFVNLELANPSGGALSLSSSDASGGEYIEFSAQNTGQSEVLGTISGNDWAVPSCDVRADNTGVYWTDTNRTDWADRLLRDVHGVDTAQYEEPRYAPVMQTSWASLNPRQGVYDWAALDKRIGLIDNSKPGVGYVLWVQAKDDPSWISAAAGTTISSKRDQVTKKNANGEYYFNQVFKDFAFEFSKRYGNDPRLVGLEMRTPWEIHSGEWVWPSSLGTSPPADVVAEFAKDFHKTWHDGMKAVGADPGKLIMQTAKDNFNGGEVLRHGYALGLGQRDGIPRRNLIWEDGYGLAVENNYWKVDETHPQYTSVREDGRISYSENTEAFAVSQSQFGPIENSYEIFKKALGWNLKIGRNWISYPRIFADTTVPNDAPAKSFDDQTDREYVFTQQMALWSQFQLGKYVDTSNEVFVSLGERNFKASANLNDSTPIQVKNNGRWLEQYDIPTGQTVGNGKTNKPTFRLNANQDQDKEFNSRRTNIATGDKHMFFDIDDRFNVRGSAHLKVGYVNNAATDFYVEYHDGTTVRKTPTVQTKNDGSKREAVTLTLPGIVANGSFDGMDFRIVNAGNKDLTVETVRVVKDCGDMTPIDFTPATKKP